MRTKLLIADDGEINREILTSILESEYDVLYATNGKEAIDVISAEKDNLAVILLDIVMPKMGGFDVLKWMKKKRLMGRIPVLIISSESATSIEREAFTYGVSDFIRKPFDSVIVRQRVDNVADLFLYKNSLESQVERQITRLKNQAEALRNSKLRLIDVLGTVVESRNLESGEHIRRVKIYTDILAHSMMKLHPEYKLSPARIKVITEASSLHDIGKISIPDSILLKPGRLTKDEYDIMKTHTIKGCEMLDNIEDVWGDAEYGRVSYEICRHHHERFDGKGYPDHLQGDDIPISAQLVSIADVYDALVNERVYKSAFSKDRAYEMIMTGECGVFSPKLLECFDACREEFEAV